MYILPQIYYHGFAFTKTGEVFFRVYRLHYTGQKRKREASPLPAGHGTTDRV